MFGGGDGGGYNDDDDGGGSRGGRGVGRGDSGVNSDKSYGISRVPWTSEGKHILWMPGPTTHDIVKDHVAR